MIEVVSSERCIQCNLCVKVCPTSVFDKGEDGIPVIARQSDCQTCFMCEAYCPVDALYVAPYADFDSGTSEEQVIVNGKIGSWRAQIGWGPGRTNSMAAEDLTPFLRKILPF